MTSAPHPQPEDHDGGSQEITPPDVNPISASDVLSVCPHPTGDATPKYAHQRTHRDSQQPRHGEKPPPDVPCEAAPSDGGGDPLAAIRVPLAPHLPYADTYFDQKHGLLPVPMTRHKDRGDLLPYLKADGRRFPGVDVIVQQQIHFRDWLRDVVNLPPWEWLRRLVAGISAAAEAGDDDRKSRLKKLLPAATVAAGLKDIPGPVRIKPGPGRAVNVPIPTGIAAFDVDVEVPPDQLDALAERFFALPSVLAVHRSASGAGLVVYAALALPGEAIDADTYERRYISWCIKHGASYADDDQKRFNRLRFYSHDPHARIKPGDAVITPWTDESVPVRPSAQRSAGSSSPAAVTLDDSSDVELPAFVAAPDGEYPHYELRRQCKAIVHAPEGKRFEVARKAAYMLGGMAHWPDADPPDEVVTALVQATEIAGKGKDEYREQVQQCFDDGGLVDEETGVDRRLAREGWTPRLQFEKRRNRKRSGSGQSKRKTPEELAAERAEKIAADRELGPIMYLDVERETGFRPSRPRENLSTRMMGTLIADERPQYKPHGPRERPDYHYEYGLEVEWVVLVNSRVFDPSKPYGFLEAGEGDYGDFNTCRRPEIKGDPDSAAGQAALDGWLTLTANLMGESVEIFHRWLAWQVQRPGQKLHWAFYVIGEKQDAGKDLSLGPVWRILGERENVFRVPPDALSMHWNEYLERCLVAYAEEMRSVGHEGKRQSVPERMKPMDYSRRRHGLRKVSVSAAGPKPRQLDFRHELVGLLGRQGRRPQAGDTRSQDGAATRLGDDRTEEERSLLQDQAARGGRTPGRFVSRRRRPGGHPPVPDGCGNPGRLPARQGRRRHASGRPHPHPGGAGDHDRLGVFPP